MRNGRRSLAIALGAIALMALILRFHRLDNVPVSVYCDEAFHGYEAWCLLETGRDSRGVLLPFFFDIFGRGWGEPLYTYATVPAVALLGLTPAAPRAVAALGGSLAVLSTALMTLELLGGASRSRARLAANIAALTMAISPWSFHLSRVGFQASLLPLALAAGFWGLARGVRSGRGGWLIGGAAALGLSFYTYTIARLAAPLLLAGFLMLHRRAFAGLRRSGIAAAAVLALLVIPVAAFSFTAAGRQRLGDVSIFNHPEVSSRGGAAAAGLAVSHYLSYFSPRFLLLSGDDNPRHSIPGHGILHPHDAALLAAGIAGAALVRSPGALFLFWWLACAPVAAALTVDPRHAVRAICGQPGLYALCGMGGVLVFDLARSLTPADWRRVMTALGWSAMLVAAGVSTAGYFRDYFTSYPLHSGPAWQYGFKEAFAAADSLGATHDSIYVTRQDDYPYILYLFHRQFPPREYQQHRLSRTKYLFDEEVFYRGAAIPGRLNPLFILKPWELESSTLTARRRIAHPDGADALVIAW